MDARIYVVLKDEDDPLKLLGMQLESLIMVKMRECVVFELEAGETANALMRILDAAGRDYELISGWRAQGVSERPVEIVKVPAEQEAVQPSVAKAEAAKDLPVEVPVVQFAPHFNPDAPQEAAEQHEPKRCEACKQMFVPTGTKKQAERVRFCKRSECKKARYRQYSKEQYEWDRQGKTEPAAPGTAGPELAAPAQAADVEDVDAFELPEPETEVEAAADFRDKVWLVEDGKMGGTKLTALQLRSYLQHGKLNSGQHVRHEQRGRHQVINIPGKPGQRLRKLFGEDAGQVVQA